MKRRSTEKDLHDVVKRQYDDAQSDGRYEVGMARMALYHRYCQDPVIFRALGDLRERRLLDLACGDGFYTRRFRSAGANPVLGLDLSPMQIQRARAIEESAPLGIEYTVGDVTQLDVRGCFDVVTAIHLIHYLASEEEIESLLTGIFERMIAGGAFVTMVINPEFDLAKHDASDSKSKYGYYFSSAEPGNGGSLLFHPGGFEKEQELTLVLRRWERSFIERIATHAGFTAEWRQPFISDEGLRTYGESFFENYLSNPQSVLLKLTRPR